MSEYGGWMAWGFGIIGVFVVITVLRELHAMIRLRAMKDLMDAVIRATSHNFEVEGEPIPERVAKAVDALKARVAATTDLHRKPEVYQSYAGNLAAAMADACATAGYWSGERSRDPRDDEIGVDFTPRELLDIKWMAHNGFQKLVGYESSFEDLFENQEEAQRAASAIDMIERYVPAEYKHPEPHAMSFNRQTMIWDRWPSTPSTPVAS